MISSVSSINYNFNAYASRTGESSNFIPIQPNGQYMAAVSGVDHLFVSSKKSSRFPA